MPRPTHPYIPTRTGWLYLAVVIDLASRRVIGWATSASLDTALPLTALQRALAVREPPRGLMHHSDRGSQYASAEYRACLAAHGGMLSMSRRGNCWDNAVVESFFATLEWELLLDADFATHAAANRALVEFINQWYITNACIPRSATKPQTSTSRTCFASGEQLKPCVH